MCNHIVDNGNGIVFECIKNHNDPMHVMRRMAVDTEPIPFVVSEFNQSNTANYHGHKITITLWQAWLFALTMIILSITLLIVAV